MNTYLNRWIVVGFVMCFWLATLPTALAQKNKKKDPVLLKVGNDEVLLSEFQYAYEKNTRNKDSLYLESNLRSYLNLYTDFKLKIQEAKDKRISESGAFQQEFESYQKILAKPYLMDSQCLDELIEEAYSRQKEIVEVSHILLTVAEEEDPKDTLAVYQKMEEIRAKALAGEDFEKLATQYSQDPKVSTNKGNLGYLTALQTVYPFENAAYITNEGNISPIFRTKYGYHILKVHQRQPNPGTVEVAHIMIQLPQGSSQSEEQKAKSKIDEIYEQLKKGENWTILCAQYSQDAATKNKEGKLPEFGMGKALPEFEKVAFALKKSGEYAAPIRTAFGWHIIKLVQKKPIPTLEIIKDELRQEILKDARQKKCEQQLIAVLKKAYNLREYPDILDKALAQADKRLPLASWSYISTDPLMNETLFSFKPRNLEAKSYTVKDFFGYVYTTQVAKPALDSTRYAMYLYYQNYLQQSTLEFERTQLSNKYSDYALLMREYEEGLMIYELMQNNVWDKAIEDTTGLRKYYEENKAIYQWTDRATSAIFELANESFLPELKAYLLKNFYPVNSIQFEPLYFDKDDSTLSEESVKTIKQVASLLRQNPDLRVEVEGHADPSEAEGTSTSRIDPTVRYLAFEKVESQRIITKDFSFTAPVSKTDRDKNRRVELKIYTTDKKELEKIFNAYGEGTLKVTEGVFEKGKNPFLNKVTWKPGSYTINHNGKPAYVEIYDLKEPRPKTYKEARGFVISDYHVYLEKEWLKQLRTRYTVEINEKVLQKISK